MRPCTSLLLVCGLTAASALRGTAQQSQNAPPDMAWRLRLAAFKSLQAGSTIRVSVREIGLRTGKVLATGDSALTLDGAGPVAYARIDSVWIRRDHATTGFLIGSVVGALASIAVVSGHHCGDLGQVTSCIASATFEGLGITLAGGLVGALVGSAAPSWKPRYP